MNVYLSKEPVMSTSKHIEEVHVLVFKTNIQFKKDLKTVGVCLQEKETVLDWNIDREDVDKVLRIESTIDNTNEIIKTITQAGFFCEELN